jgi:hypothetical protein
MPSIFSNPKAIGFLAGQKKTPQQGVSTAGLASQAPGSFLQFSGGGQQNTPPPPQENPQGGTGQGSTQGLGQNGTAQLAGGTPNQGSTYDPNAGADTSYGGASIDEGSLPQASDAQANDIIGGTYIQDPENPGRYFGNGGYYGGDVEGSTAHGTTPPNAHGVGGVGSTSTGSTDQGVPPSDPAATDPWNAYLDDIFNNRGNFDPIEAEIKAKRDKSLSDLAEMMASRGMGDSGVEGSMAGDVFQGAARDIASSQLDFQQKEQKNMAQAAQIILGDQWKQMDINQQERMAALMLKNEEQLFDYMRKAQSGDPGPLMALMDDLRSTISGSGEYFK